MKKVFLDNMGVDGFGRVYIAPVNGYEVCYDGRLLGNEFAPKGKDVSANIIHSRIYAAWQYGEELDESKFTINKYEAHVVWQEVSPGGAGHAQYVLGGGLNKLKNKKAIGGKGPGTCHDEAVAYNLGKSDKKPTAFDLTALIGEHEVVAA
jgi:hypothetical protein